MSAQNVLSSYTGQSGQYSQFDTAYVKILSIHKYNSLVVVSPLIMVKFAVTTLRDIWCRHRINQSSKSLPMSHTIPVSLQEHTNSEHRPTWDSSKWVPSLLLHPSHSFLTHSSSLQVPGLSMFHHDQMPYFLCCKYADFRCQMFYWRRPSSGCQEYQPPAYGRSSLPRQSIHYFLAGEILGAGSFNTIDNMKFIFNEPGVFTLLYIPQTSANPEVKIQVRMEKYPNRKVDFSEYYTLFYLIFRVHSIEWFVLSVGMLGKYIDQQDLVQPTNATVITGIAMEATGTDRVLVLARGDTRR